MNKILDVFYNQIISEAAKGEIDAFLKYNIVFSTEFVEENKRIDASSITDEVIIPTLKITDKEKFDKLLVEYVTLACNFYDDFDQLYDKFDDQSDNKELWRLKTIFVNLFANASIDDFNNPCEYLQRRINFINNSCEEKVWEGYSEILKSTISVEIKKDTLSNEAPYKFGVVAIDELGQEFDFPYIRFGISNNKAYVYAIQNSKKSINDSKKIKRGLYKVGEGFDLNEDNYENYEEGNLKDVSSSFVVAINMFASYLSTIGINEIVVPSILIERYNAKTMATKKRLDHHIIDEDRYNEIMKFNSDLQSNLTEKLLRTVMRLGSHYEDFKVLSYPMEVDSYLHFDITNQEECNNNLLRETNMLVKKGKNKTK